MNSGAVQAWPLSELAERDDLSALYVQNMSALVLLNLTLIGSGVPARQLASVFGFEVPSSLSNLQEQATYFVGDAGNKIAAAAAGISGLSSIVTVFTDSQGLVNTGVDVLGSAWTSFLHLTAQLGEIFATFGPLKPLFASQTGLVQLLSSSAGVQTLVSVVQQLLSTSSVLEAISDACRTIVDIFNKLSGTFSAAMEKLTGKGTRRLLVAQGRKLSVFSYEQLLSGIDFKDLISQMGACLTKATGYAKELAQVNATLGPLLSKWGGSTSGVRRLTGASPDQKEYQQAIEKIIPAWQGVEGLGISMCPEVLSAQEVAIALKCRVDGFVGAGGGLGALSNLLNSCPAKSASTSPDMVQCPKESMSAGVTDLLSKNAFALGWVMWAVAGVGALGALCAGGAVAAKKVFARGGDDGDGSESEHPLNYSGSSEEE
ncbi:unnamed protein product [Polarella glacialis]|uniref:Uncharacterized protein n=1 Tax=Polarella glacialis TaxID=89957 RepID=A0A813EFD2_POLGL|nr:unnamed protein product [Polarella glacialis]CAE8650092.1 unnamed protein product [Polarella glacialis]